MKVNSYFDKLLENIEPDLKYKNYAAEAHTRVRDYLQTEDPQFSDFIIDSFLYGSYARHTAEGNIKDVDIALITNLDPTNEDHKPSKVLPKLKKALTRLYEDKGATDSQRKSIQVLDPLPEEEDAELTLDIIPTVLTGTDQEKLLVPDTENDIWIESHPKAHLAFTSILNDEEHGNGMFVPLVKIMKHWWKLHAGVEKAKPKGFWLEILTGYTFDPTKGSYSEHFVAVLENISHEFSDYESLLEVPEINDPGLPDEVLKTSMTLGEFVHFMDAVTDTLAIAKEALASQNQDQSIHLWHAIFGDEFPKSVNSSTFDLSKVVNFVTTFFAPKEQFLQRDFNIPFEDLGHSVKIDAWVTKNNGFRDGYNSKLPLIQKKASLLFKIITCSVSEQYTVMWKVKNTGREAARLGKQRGEIHRDDGTRERIESTLYTGTHYVECYIIDSRNICIAWDRIKVRII